MKFKFTLILSLWCSLAFAQLSPFQLYFGGQTETCTGNASLEFIVLDDTPGSTISFEIFKAPDYTTPIAVTTDLIYGGLTAGSYRVIATQTLGNESNTVTADWDIYSDVMPLNYTATRKPQLCGNDGSIIINVTSGTAVSYEITAGPITFPPQASKIFTGLPAGTYTIRVVDVCNEVKILGGQVIDALNGNFTLSTSPFYFSTLNCNTIKVRFDAIPNSGSVLMLPLTYEYTVYPPGGGAPVIITSTSGVPGSYQTTTYISAVDIPFYNNQTYKYDLKVTDACGRIERKNNVSINQKFIIIPSIQVSSCSKNFFNINASNYTNYTLDFLSAPAGFNPTDYNSNYPGPYNSSIVSFGSVTKPVPAGSYRVKAVDACSNREFILDFIVTYSISTLAAVSKPSCSEGLTTFIVDNPTAKKLKTATITAAPVGFPYSLPYDMSLITDLNGNKNFKMVNVPGGSYTITTLDDCGDVRTKTFNFLGLESGTNSVSVTESCGSFSLDLSSSNTAFIYYLQKYDPVSGLWVHPTTGASYSNGITIINAYRLTIGTNNSLSFTGRLRVVKTSSTYSDNLPIQDNYLTKQCQEVVKEFTINQAFNFQNIYAFSCSNGLLNVGISAAGNGPFFYRITTKNGASFIVDNGSSNLFTGLTPGVYNFQIIDACGNTLNRQYDVTKLSLPKITPANICEGQSGQLFVEGVPYLNFKWWKEGNPSVILSTTNKLLFNSFSSAVDAGTYNVELTSANGSACLNQVLQFVIPANTSAPNAGLDGTINIATLQTTAINLFDYIGGSYDNYGTWEEITNSGSPLSGSNWVPNVPVGTYKFRYKVSGSCSGEDFSIVTVNIVDPMNPILIDLTGECTVTAIAPTTTDLSGNTITGTTTDPLTYDAQGTYVINWTFEDGNGNMVTVPQKVIIKDVTKPIIPTLTDVTNECATTVTAPTTTDNCAGTIIGTTADLLTYNTQGNYTITWTFEDGNGNVVTSQQNVIIKDITKPVEPTLDDVTAECNVTVIAPTTTDNCAGTITGTTMDLLTYNTQGTHTIKWTFDDGNGNSITVPQKVIVTGSLAPTVTITAQPTCSTKGSIEVKTVGTVTYTVTATNPAKAPISNTTGIFTDLEANDYNVITTDLSGCVSQITQIKLIAPICPSLTLTKKYTNTGTKAGDIINYEFVIENTSNIEIWDVQLSDPGLDPGSRIKNIPSIPVSSYEIVTGQYTLKQADIDAGKYVNQASATANDLNQTKFAKDDFSDDPTTVAPDDETVLLIPQNPSVSLVKTAIAKDNYIAYTFTIKNTGNVTLYNFNLTDIRLGINNRSLPLPNGLAPGVETTVNEQYILSQGDKDAGFVKNTAKVTAKDPQGSDVEDISGTTESNDNQTNTTVQKSPIAVDDYIEITTKHTIIPILTNDSFSPTPINKLTIEIIAAPQHGTVSVNADGTVNYTPSPGYNGDDTYTYRLKDEYGYYSNVATVIIKSFIDITVPNLFTPNGDGINDTFEIRGLSQFLENNLIISNRWGNEVYKSNNYKNTWTGEGLNEGTYFYLLRVKQVKTNEWKTYKGYLTLIKSFKKNE